jgi:topoisomerase-4 subunit A
VAVLAPGQKLVVWCGDRSMTLGGTQLAEYRGERAQRGAMLSRNYRKVDRLEVQ